MPRDGTGERAVALDDANKKIEQKLALMGGKWREHAHLSRPHRRLQPDPQRFSARREMQHARAPIRAVHAAVDQAHGLELVHKLAHAGAVHTHSRGDAVLIDAGLARHTAEVRQDRELS